MTATIIDGKAIALELRQQLADEVELYAQTYGSAPGLSVLLVGNDPASEVYVRNKVKACEQAGIDGFTRRLPIDIPEAALIDEIDSLNANANVHGILVQLPLPAHINEDTVINAVTPEKDVDGFHPINAGKLLTGQNGLFPCTPMGCIHLLKHALGNLAGKHAVVIGRSNIVGKPMAQLLLREDCTVTIVHSKTVDLPALTRQADIVISGVGKTEFVKADWIKPGAAVIDVGINRIEQPDGGKAKLVGDVAFDEVKEVAGFITPVPGGVGPMTIACLLQNTLKAARALA